MFTEMLSPRLKARVSESSLLKVLSWPQGVDSFTEVADRSWTQHEGRATVTAVRWQTPRSVTLTLRPNALGAQLFADFRAGQHINVAVEIDGRRHTRCYSPVAAEGSALIELTIGRHDGGLVSDHLYRHARPGTVVGIGAPAGDFVLDPTDARILLVSGGSGITPVLSMLRTLRAGGHTGEVAFVHYARTPEDVAYAAELRELAAAEHTTVLFGYTRSGAGELSGHLRAEHLATALADPDAVYVCGPAALVDAVREVHPEARSESFVPPAFRPGAASGGLVSFAGSEVFVEDDGKTLLEQAENVGLTPEFGCRMGICHGCTRLKSSGVVKNVTTGVVSSAEEEEIQICVTVPCGDVVVEL
ncbi:flavin reductase family protein [Mycolicibacterium fallax]|uniref:Ferredoxin reductase n=1 Tax=Mycolicibacterium fallax TaxID=1793 RepID=A0A1X1RF21_MYCFA|nr:iron-sulfur cluster-binding domain-containing protein [Mycolicibacterium fallax]ORV04299.1 ferredoxin reductase [Mycolicibacterium fallax]BBY98484.1 oxidoreductase [Mycolicibacterium fallax]HOW93100.1 iron-sulfur cluster-binding domain-containing protein [Mycolicibacterium fallax]HSA39981.1 iron-sulfur cluster-binding domain-containing protein [Mycobacterium sp.]